MRLNQLLAIEKGEKARSAEELTALYHKVQKATLFNGRLRTYQPKNEEGDQLPSEEELVQATAADVLKDMARVRARVIDLVASKDMANTFRDTIVPVEIDEVQVLPPLPVPTLIFLEKYLQDLLAVVKAIPTLDPSERWKWNPDQDLFESEQSKTYRTQKEPKALVKAEATDKHPAQVETYWVDNPVGTWTTRKFSGAMQAERKKAVVDRINTLRNAVKAARERANMVEVGDGLKIGDALFEYLLAE